MSLNLMVTISKEENKEKYLVCKVIGKRRVTWNPCH